MAEYGKDGLRDDWKDCFTISAQNHELDPPEKIFEATDKMYMSIWLARQFC